MTGLLPLLLACNETNLGKVQRDAIAVVLGDFDDMNAVLVALDVAAVPYDGFIVQAAYEPERDRTRRGSLGVTVEMLLGSFDSDGRRDLSQYGTLFLASGTRGLGAGQYNNALVPDDTLLVAQEGEDAPLVRALCDFVEGGGTLVLSDWAYDVVETCWPDAVSFVGDGDGPDAAQVGVAEADLVAEVVDEELAAAFGPTAALQMDYSAWSVMRAVGEDVDVLLRGDASYQPDPAEPIVDGTELPLLVRLQPGAGTVIYGSFHWGAQNPILAQNLVRALVTTLPAPAATESR
ncbi:MAG: hypothetical protein RLZZ299_1286 [Pseudomonadota bacterium]|jgi:hypothetical protein